MICKSGDEGCDGLVNAPSKPAAPLLLIDAAIKTFFVNVVHDVCPQEVGELLDCVLEKDAKSGLETWDPFFEGGNAPAYLSDLFVKGRGRKGGGPDGSAQEPNALCEFN